MKVKTIENVSYKRPVEHVGANGFGVDYMENEITYGDGSMEIRLGITRVEGKNIKEMTSSLLNAMKQLQGWWSLQTTSLSELKAAYRAGYRNRSLSSLEQHVEAFHNSCGTLHVELIAI